MDLRWLPRIGAVTVTVAALACHNKSTEKPIWENNDAGEPTAESSSGGALTDVENVCWRSNDGIIIHVAIDVTIIEGRMRGYSSRELFHIQCDTSWSERSCSGAKISMTNLDKENRIAWKDVGEMRGVTLLTATPTTATIQHGVMTFVADFAQHRVTYSAQSLSGVGTGEATCSGHL